MRNVRFVALSLAGLIVAGAAAALHASDRVAVYARVDRVVLAPDATAPRTIQVFGVFSVAKPSNPNDYEPPAKGYLYFTLADGEAQARREWADLKAIAGTRQIVALGNRFTMKARVRAEKDPPANPDPYATDTGLTKIDGRTDYPPIRALLDFRN
jgi:hypothetical protein